MTLTAALARDADIARARKAAEDERLAAAVLSERVKRTARRVIDAEERERVEIPALQRLDEALALPVPPLEYRIEQFQPAGTRIVAAAQFKAGKTTLVGNYVRSIVDGDLFLGRYHVTPIEGAVAVVDLEMSHRQLLGWFRDQEIRHTDRVCLLPLRGRAGCFDVFSIAGRRPFVERFKAANVQTLVIDCGRPILDAFALDEHRDVGRLLTGVDTLLAEAGISEALVVQHMGHNGERSRGDSKWRDWPDVEWRLMRKDEDPASPRYLSAYGRDVDVPEQELAYDAATRRLTVVGGSRRDAAAKDAVEAILDVLRAAGEPLSGRAIKRQLEDSGIGRDGIDAALKMGVESGRLHRSDGPRKAKLYRQSAAVSGVSGECPADGRSECPAPYIGPDARTLTPTEIAGANRRTLGGEADGRHRI